MNTIKCPTCEHENKNTNIRCELCGTELNHIEQINDSTFNNVYHLNTKTLNINPKIIKFIFIVIMIFWLAPWFLGGLAFIGVSTYVNITDNNKSKNYIETEGKLVSFEECHDNGNGKEICNGIYEYVVDGVTYKGEPNFITERSKFKQTTTVKYNPNNPSEYVMDSNMSGFLIFGILLVIVPLVILISSIIFIKKISNKANSIKKDN